MLPNQMILVSSLLICVIASGCGDGVHSVAGKVVYKEDKSPFPGAEGALITFFPIDENGYLISDKPSPQGEIESDGSFKLDHGAPLGKYRVTVTPPDIYDDDPATKKHPPLGDSYKNSNDSPIIIEITAESAGDIRVEVAKSDN